MLKPIHFVMLTLYYESDCSQLHEICSSKRPRVEEQHQNQRTAVMPDEDVIGMPVSLVLQTIMLNLFSVSILQIILHNVLFI
jgi:hypothetical protein